MSAVPWRLSTVALACLIAGACVRSEDAPPTYVYADSIQPSEEAGQVETTARRGPEAAFAQLDEDGDGSLSLAEYLADRRSSTAVQMATDVFRLSDLNGNGRLSLEEFSVKPPQVRFRQMDRNGDGGLSVGEFHRGDMASARFRQALKVFALVDRNDDGKVDFGEYQNRTQEARAARMDEDGDGQLSLQEFENAHKDLVAGGRSGPAFAAMDRNGDAMLSIAEFTKRPQEADFLFRDRDNDGKISLEEFSLWKSKQDPESLRTAYEKKDADADGLLTFREYAYAPADKDFWAADRDGDARVGWAELAPAAATVASAPAGQPNQAAGRLRKLFAEIDQNGDESMSLEEFRARRNDLVFYCRDADRDSRLSVEEFKAGFDETAEGIAEAEKTFRAKDRDEDAKLTFNEFNTTPPKMRLWRLDTDGDGLLDPQEFHQGDMASASAERARAVFDTMDQDKDGKLNPEEFRSRPAEAWFLRSDADEDGYCSFAEYIAVNGGPAKKKFCLTVFAAMDRNGDRLLDSEEFCDKSPEAMFHKRDGDSDGVLTLEEYVAWAPTPEKIAQAKAEFGQRDANGDGRLDLREHLYRPADNDFWAADENGDLAVDLDELRKRMPVAGDEAAGAKLGEIFKTIDQNGDGRVSLPELKRQPAQTRFQWLDLNQDAQLALEEFVGRLEDAQAIAQAEKTFQGKDKDGNGSLSPEEFTGGGN